MLKALDSLVKSGQLKVEPTSKPEVGGFLANAEQALVDAQLRGLSSANRFKLAYDAAHALSLVALRLRGYRPGSGPGHRAIVFKSLVHAVGAPVALASSLNRYHTKRNRSEYDGLVIATDAEARDIIALTTNLKTLVVRWIKQNRPELLP